jgi:hypothetical protein
MVTYGVYLRCIFCKKREWVGKVSYTPPKEVWDTPDVSLLDVVEMRGRGGMPTICCTNWIYPELYGPLIEHFNKHLEGMVKTLVVSKFGPEILEELEQYYKDRKDKLGMAVADVEGVGKFLVPSGLYEAFQDMLNRIKTGQVKKGSTPRREYKGPKIFTRTYNADGSCDMEEEWRVAWNTNMVAFGSAVGTDDETGMSIISLLNKSGDLIPYSTIPANYITERKTRLTSAGFTRVVKRELDHLTDKTRRYFKRRREFKKRKKK